MKRYLPLAIILGLLVTAAPASADVLLSAPLSRATSSACISIGVWYQAYSGGPRTVSVSLYRPDGRRVARRTIVATTHWRTYTLKCGMWPYAGRWQTRVTGATRAVFLTRVRLDQD
jgi:hypothetical protein